MLGAVRLAPPDPILGLSAAFARDRRPERVNLGVGEYRDADGDTPVLASVRRAEADLVAAAGSKRYLPIDGSPEYGAAVRRLLLGAAAADLAPRSLTLQAPGGTGALRLAADFLRAHFPDATVWLSAPTWANHPRVFAAAGLRTAAYPYYDAEGHRLDVEGMFAALAGAAAGDVVLVHGCCHNPTGADLDLDGWRQLGRVLAEGEAVPLVDLAYQGFGVGLEADAAGLRALLDLVPELLVASSCSKNFGLYRERVGALTAITAHAAAAAAVLSQLKICVRTSFSNPPAHGAAIVTRILDDPDLRRLWEDEVGRMRARIRGMRALLVERLAAHGAGGDFGFVTAQRGMFSLLGLRPDQVDRLRQEHAVYVVGSGRINVAGITPDNVDRLCAAIAAVR